MTYHGCALPTELSRHIINLPYKYITQALIVVVQHNNSVLILPTIRAYAAGNRSYRFVKLTFIDT